MAHAGGRPTKYNELMLSKTENYVTSFATNPYEVIEVRSRGKIKQKRCERVPSIQELSILLGVNETTIYEWRKRYDDFDFQIDRLLNIQYVRATSGGLSGTLNPTIAKLIIIKNMYKDEPRRVRDGRPRKPRWLMD
jgi:hypothetical protein